VDKPEDRLYLAGRVFDVTVVDEMGERPGEGEATHGYDGECDWDSAAISVSGADDSTLAHELGHLLARARGVYLSEYQIQVFEELFTVLRDPRNGWLVRYFEGDEEE
jgi:hypothetical protein